ncbi:Coiled-coil domain-containing protein 187, partial [Lemmus lemmus]
SVPRTNVKRIRSASCKRETPKSSVPRRSVKGRGSDKEAGVGDTSVHTWFSKPPCARGDQQVSEHTPSLAFHDQSGTIQGAMELLQDLRQQIQTGLELARRPRAARKLSSSKPKSQNLAGKSQQRPQSPWDIQGSSKSTWTAAEERCSSLGRAGNLHSQQHWKKAATERESCPQRAWAAQGQHTSFQRPGSTPEKPGSFSQRPWSALAWQTSPQRTWETRGQDPSFQRSGSPPKKSSPFSQRPWSALAGQACPQRTYTAGEDWGLPGYSSWSSIARPHPFQQPWTSASVQSPYSKDKSAGPPPSKVKPAWPEPAQYFSQSKPAKEQDTLENPPCPRQQQSLGRPRNSESLGDFVRQKAQARRQQAMEQKALAAHTLELQNQRLQEVFRKQRETILGKAVPVVSQRSPGIVTFVPSSVQSGDLEAPGSLGSPLRQWSKVTSGMLLGNQEAPDSFCLCLNKPWNHAETQDTGCPREGYKQARLQALETMADVLKQRIDILTTKLNKLTSPDTADDLASDMLPLGPSTAPTTPTLTPPSYLRSLVSDGSRGTPQDWVDMQGKPLFPSTYFQDSEVPPWSPSWKPQSSNLGTHIESQPQGLVSSTPASVSQVIPHTQPCLLGSSSHGALSKGAIEERHQELEKKLQREMATLQALGAYMRSSIGVPAAPDPTCGSLWQEEKLETKKADLVTPWTTQSCGKGKPADRPWAGWSGGQGGLPWASSTA